MKALRAMMSARRNNTCRKPLVYADIRVGMKVIDNDGDIGIITQCEDPHNVIIRYDNEGVGIYCLVESCELFGRSLLYVCP